MSKFIRLSDLAPVTDPKPATITVETREGVTVHMGDGKWTHLRRRRNGRLSKGDMPRRLEKQARRAGGE